MESNEPQSTDKVIGIVAYITIIGLIIAFILNMEKKDAFASFHIRQALGIFVTAVASSIVSVIPFIGWAVAVAASILVFLLWVMGLINAIGGQMKPVPILGEKFEEWFQSVG